MKRTSSFDKAMMSCWESKYSLVSSLAGIAQMIKITTDIWVYTLTGVTAMYAHIWQQRIKSEKQTGLDQFQRHR